MRDSNGIILKSGTATAAECLDYALNLPASVVVTRCDSIEILQQHVTRRERFAR